MLGGAVCVELQLDESDKVALQTFEVQTIWQETLETGTTSFCFWFQFTKS